MTITAQKVDDIDINRIKELIPHRYPMLLVDKLCDINLGERAVGIKAVTINEPFFQGHFPEKPVMPGVLIVEAMAQTAACVACRNDLSYLSSVELSPPRPRPAALG